MTGSIWEDATPELYFTDLDFEEEFGRSRTPEEQAAHEIFCEAAELEEAAQITIGPGDGEGGHRIDQPPIGDE